MLKASLNPDALTWLHFISTNVQPTTHTSDITKEQALLIHLFMTAQRVKVENIIHSSLTAACVSGRQDAALIFPHLISDSFLQGGIPDPAWRRPFLPLNPCDYHFLRRFPMPHMLPPAPPVVVPADPVQGVDPIHQLAADLAAFRTRFDHFEVRHDLQMEFIVAGLRELGVQAPFNEVDTDNAATERETEQDDGDDEGTGDSSDDGDSGDDSDSMVE